MESYITYEEYHTTFGKSLIPQNEFSNYSINASQKVRLQILNRPITGYEDEVKLATCLVADILYNQTQYKNRLSSVILGNSSIISSEKVDDYSRQMATPSLEDLKKMQSDDYTNSLINSAILETLAFTGLLYKGIEVV